MGLRKARLSLTSKIPVKNEMIIHTKRQIVAFGFQVATQVRNFRVFFFPVQFPCFNCPTVKGQDQPQKETVGFGPTRQILYFPHVQTEISCDFCKHVREPP